MEGKTQKRETPTVASGTYSVPVPAKGAKFCLQGHKKNSLHPTHKTWLIFCCMQSWFFIFKIPRYAYHANTFTQCCVNRPPQLVMCSPARVEFVGSKELPTHLPDLYFKSSPALWKLCLTYYQPCKSSTGLVEMP